jgi:Flp pilus assembly protein TadG
MSLHSLWRRRDGTTALEFAMIATPLFWLLFGMAEFGAISMAQTTLDSAVFETARKIRTGEAQAGGMTQAEFKEEICAGINEIMQMDCDLIWADVKKYDNFGGINTEISVDGSGLSFTPGGPDEIVLVRVYYQWEIFTPMFSAILANTSGEKRILVSSMLFRNEPF